MFIGVEFRQYQNFYHALKCCFENKKVVMQIRKKGKRQTLFHNVSQTCVSNYLEYSCMIAWLPMHPLQSWYQFFFYLFYILIILADKWHVKIYFTTLYNNKMHVKIILGMYSEET